MKISQLRDRSLLFYQRKYIYDHFFCHGIENCASITTSMMKEVKLSQSSDKNACNAKTQAHYRILLGELMYLMVQTRPDFAYSVSKLA